MSAAVDRLETHVKANDARAVADTLRGKSEKERKAAGARLREQAKHVFDYRGDRVALAIAVLGTCGGVRQATDVLSRIALGGADQIALEVLTERSPAWLTELPGSLLKRESISSTWPLVRGLVRAGRAPRPDVPEYTFAMIHAARRAYRAGDYALAVEQLLRADPELLTEDVFRLFTVEGAGRQLYWMDGSLGREDVNEKSAHLRRAELTWRATLTRLARAGLIDFDKLLDHCLGAFLSDFKPTGLGWYVSFHETLAPTVKEMSRHGATYVRLLSADASVAVGLAQKAVRALLSSKAVDPAEVVRESTAVLHRPEKGAVLTQLKLLEQIASDRKDLVPQIVAVVSSAVEHEQRDVADQFRKFLAKVGHVAPDRAARTSQSVDTGSDDAWLREAEQRIAELNVRIGAGSALPAPITDPDELVDLLTRLIEKPTSPIDLERGLAGAVRTARLDLAQRKRIAEPMAKRALEQSRDWPSGLLSSNVRAMIACVAYTWASGVEVRPAKVEGWAKDFAFNYTCVDKDLRPVTPTGIFAVRCMEAIHAIAHRQDIELIAEPTHERGGVGLAAFVERFERSYGGRVGRPTLARLDIELAVLRLAPQDREAVETRIARSGGAARSLVRKAVAESSDDRTLTLVIGAPHTDRSYEHPEPVVVAKVGGNEPNGGVMRTLTALDDPLRTYRRLAGEWEFASGSGFAISTWSLLAPWDPELVAAHLLRPLSRGLRSGKGDLSAAAVSAFSHEGTSLGPIGHVALALGLMGAEGDTRTAAADVFELAARQGRLVPARMADAWCELARGGQFYSKRLAAAVEPLLQSPAAGYQLARCFELALPLLLGTGARDLHVLLRMSADLTADYGHKPMGSAIDEIARKKSSSELAIAARHLASTSAGGRLRAEAVKAILESASRSLP